MQCSPTFFTSPGPDPYRSNDNVYEELEHRNSTDIPIHRHSINKSSSDNTTIATIYQETGGGGGSAGASGTYIDRNRVERNSLLSSASSSIHGGSNNESNVLRNNLHCDGSNLFRYQTSAAPARRSSRGARGRSGFKSSNSDHIDLRGDSNNNKNDQQGEEEDSEVERLNRRNAQLSHSSSGMLREHNFYRPTRANYYAPPQHIIAINNQIRTNPQTEARENIINNNNSNTTATYDDPYMTSISPAYDESGNQIYHHPYMATFRNYNNLNNPHQPLYNCNAMGSDSGYSQNTQASDGRSMRGRGRKSNKSNTMGNSRGMRLRPYHQNAGNYDEDS